MPTTQRLLTDETGQALVTAINNIVAAVKPNATEIQMGANDTTTVAEAINSTNQALSNLKIDFKSFSTTSDFDSLTSGFINAVTFASGGTAQANLPFTANASLTIYGGGSYIHLVCTRANGEMYTRSKNNGTWDASWQQLALKSDIVTEEISNIQPDEAISAGTPGTRGAQKIVSYNCPAGYTVSSVMVTYANNSSLVHPFIFLSNTNLYVNWYRATANAIDVSSAGIRIRLTYIKS